jgi:hypothetical protein
VADVLAEKLELTGSEIDALMPPAWIARHGDPCTALLFRCYKCQLDSTKHLGPQARFHCGWGLREAELAIVQGMLGLDE